MRTVSIKAYLVTSIRKLRFVRYARNLKDAVKIILLWFLDSIPIPLRYKADLLVRRVNELITRNPIILEINDVKMIVKEFNDIIILSNETEKEVWRYLELKPGDVFVDIGAHKGKYALPAAKIVKNGNVVAIEPSPENYSALLMSVKLNGFKNIKLLKLAAWNKATELSFFICPFNSQLSSVKKEWKGSIIKVKADTVDHMLVTLGIKRCDVVKIDVEGAEYEVLLGMCNILSNYAPKIIIEVRDENLVKVMKFLKDFGYMGIPIKGLRSYYYFFKPRGVL